MLTPFKYKLSEDITNLAMASMANFYDEYILGWMDPGDTHQLAHCSMYMVCEIIDARNNIIGNPVAIVAKNERRAMDIYNEATKKVDAMIYYCILDNCKNVKVLPIDE